MKYSPLYHWKYSPLYYSVKHWKYSWNICPNLSFCLLQCTPCRFHSDPIWRETNKSKIPLSRSSTSTYFFLTMWHHGMGVNIIKKFCVDPYFFPLMVNEWLIGGRHRLWQAGNQLLRIFFLQFVRIFANFLCPTKFVRTSAVRITTPYQLMIPIRQCQWQHLVAKMGLDEI